MIGDIEGIPAGPDAPRMYATCDTVQAHHFAGRPEQLIGSAGTLIVNAGEAALLTGQSDPEEAAVALARLVATAIVTLGAEGAVAVSGGVVAHAEAPRQSARALVGAGDVFAAAYVVGRSGGLAAGRAARAGVPLRDALAARSERAARRAHAARAGARSRHARRAAPARQRLLVSTARPISRRLEARAR